MMQEDDPPASAPAPVAFVGPVKHSVTIRGHRTSISLEPVFWDALCRAAEEKGEALNALVARIDEARIAALSMTGRHGRQNPANLASALRIWLWKNYCE